MRENFGKLAVILFERTNCLIFFLKMKTYYEGAALCVNSNSSKDLPKTEILSKIS